MGFLFQSISIVIQKMEIYRGIISYVKWTKLHRAFKCYMLKNRLDVVHVCERGLLSRNNYTSNIHESLSSEFCFFA